MKIAELFKQKRRIFSLEIFPPKPDVEINTVYDTIDKLAELPADFISVTYGASGSTAKTTVNVAQRILNYNKMLPLPHYTCIDTNHAAADGLISNFRKLGIDNILALRGDLPEGCLNDGPFRYATDFIRYLREHSELCIGAAAYPEGHSDTKNLIAEMNYLKMKSDFGADFFITQLFFDNSFFYKLLEQAQKHTIAQPILAGIMPVLNSKSLLRIIKLSGVSVPLKLSKLVARYGDNPEEMEKAGIDYAAGQIDDLVANKVAGIHLYCMNRPNVAKNIFSRCIQRSK
ncbi:MAG: methylenetetrahydrofolate reductase [Negativicutes bacterium]|jgi:methylenetetrahydrofolate reductase (NADPH)